MTRKQQRIFAVFVVMVGAGLAVGLSLMALRENVTFFFSPSDITGDDPRYTMPPGVFRLGGLVKDGSVRHEGMKVHFTVTDNLAEIDVVYEGIVPDLFREGQGVVATGRMAEQEHVFKASGLLAKHDENYMPPEVAKALKKTAAEKGHPDKGAYE